MSEWMSEEEEEEGEVKDKAQSPCAGLQAAEICASLSLFLRQREMEEKIKTHRVYTTNNTCALQIHVLTLSLVFVTPPALFNA